jgi:hypothetical protein
MPSQSANREARLELVPRRDNEDEVGLRVADRGREEFVNEALADGETETTMTEGLVK